jgi:uncharacterized protein YdeI (YjbR/CyaY-like superfamily)
MKDDDVIKAATWLPFFFGGSMDVRNPKVDAFFDNANAWKPELETLRKLLLDSPLTEDFKWRGPCYTYENKAVVLIGNFKSYCSMGFYKGSLLKDPHGILVAPGENSQSMRMARFTSVEEINGLTPVLKKFILQAMENERAGLKVEFKQAGEQDVPVEFQKKLDGDAALKKAFEALTPGRQRAYLLYFSALKQSNTREARIEKLMPRILAGKGFQD